MAQDQRLRHGVAERADADLQRAAVGNGARGVQAGGIVGKLDRLARRREQRKVGRRAVEQQSNSSAGDGRVARHERQFGVDLRRRTEIRRVPARRAASRSSVRSGLQLRLKRVSPSRSRMRHQLRDDVDAAVEHDSAARGCSSPRCSSAARTATPSHCPAWKKNSLTSTFGGSVPAWIAAA